jgi:hypothetical protein
MGAEYLPLIESLMKVDGPIVLFGGFAEDAMLGGAIRRHHDDVDVLIERSSSVAQESQWSLICLVGAEGLEPPTFAL